MGVHSTVKPGVGDGYWISFHLDHFPSFPIKYLLNPFLLMNWHLDRVETLEDHTLYIYTLKQRFLSFLFFCRLFWRAQHLSEPRKHHLLCCSKQFSPCSFALECSLKLVGCYRLNMYQKSNWLRIQTFPCPSSKQTVVSCANSKHALNDLRFIQSTYRMEVSNNKYWMQT